MFVIFRSPPSLHSLWSPLNVKFLKIGTRAQNSGFGELDLLLQFAKIFLFGLMTPKLGQKATGISNKMKILLTKVRKFLNDDGEMFKEEDFEDDDDSTTDDDGNESETGTRELQENVKAHEAIYKTSKCFIELDNYMQDCEYDNQGTENNFYSPGFANAFLKNHLSYVLLWGRPMTYKRSKDARRANNGAIENHFMQKKRDAREASLEIGTFGKIPCGRYVQHLSEVTDTTIKGILYDIPSRARTRNNRKKSSQSSSSSSQQSQENQISESGVLLSAEQYRKRTPKGAKKQSVFFSQPELNSEEKI